MGAEVLTDAQVDYSVVDVVYIPEIVRQQYLEFQKQPKLFELFKMEMQLLPYITDMELAGVYFNQQRVLEVKARKVEEQAAALARLQKALPWVPLTKTDASKKKMREKYPDLVKPVANTNDFKKAYKILGVELPKKKQKNPKTGKTEYVESLDKKVIYQLDHPSKKDLIEFTTLSKLITAYLNKMPEWQSPVTKRVHCFINQVGAETGRPQASDPNLMTVPNTQEIRSLVEAQDPDYVLIAADFSQVELRLAGVAYGDTNMQEAYLKGIDLHKTTASQMFKVTYDQVVKGQRKGAKGVNFGSIYGQTPRGLQDYLRQPIYGVEATIDECKEWLAAFFKLYPGIKSYHDMVMNRAYQAKIQGDVYVASNLVGRTRYWTPDQITVMEFTNYDGSLKRIPIVNDIINHPVQSTASEFMKYSIMVVSELFRKYNLTRTKLILPVHDELVAESHKDEAKLAAVLMYKGMRYAAESCVLAGISEIPIEVEVKIGRD